MLNPLRRRALTLPCLRSVFCLLLVLMAVAAHGRAEDAALPAQLLRWHKHPNNPVFRPEPKNDWESHYVTSESLLRQADGSWRMWYASRTKPPFVHKYFAIGSATWKGPAEVPDRAQAPSPFRIEHSAILTSPTELHFAQSRAAQYLAVDPARNEQSAIVLQFDAAHGTGFDWAAITKPRVAYNSPEARLREAVMFLQDGIRRMTGVKLEVRSDSELRRGIVIALLENAPADLRDDPAVRRALRNDGSDAYNDREAFFLRSEPERLVIIANTVDGLSAAMPALLETVGYEVLGMGPNWIHVPTDRKRLVFDVELADRAGFYLRQITPTSGQQRGVGTIMTGPKLSLSDPRDESVTDSYTRWAIGIRNHGHSMAAAFQKMLPREPSGDYRIPSIAYYADHTLDGLPARWSAAPARIVADLRSAYDGGMRAMNLETDFNFGKYGLAYYLMSKVLWNSRLTAEQLDAIRDRWLQRSFGNGWREMKAYYDFMLVENYPANAPGTWAKAIRLIDAADARIDPAAEPDAKRRIDDVKQYWYWYYLLDTERAKRDAPELLEFLWKGQMSYMTAMHMAVKRTNGNENFRLETVVPESLRRGPAHYTPEETAAWWQRMHEHWPEIEVFLFSDAVLVDGRKGRDIDLNDLVRVADFQSLTTGKPLQYNSAQVEPYPFLTTAKAGETIGFKFTWPANTDQLQFYGPKDVPYGIEWWDAAQRQWTPVVDVTATTAASQLVTNTPDGKPRHVAEMRYSASRTGTYRIEVGRGGFLANLASLGYDVTQGTHTSRPPQTFFTRLTGLTQDPVYLYIPKGTKSLDLENWRSAGRKQVQLHRGVNAKGLVKSRTIDIDRRGTHRITLEPGEDGQLAQISSNGFAFPLLYSVPSLWSKCPAELLIPRAIAEADGLKIVE